MPPPFYNRLRSYFLTKQAGYDALVALSLANLCLLRVWSALLFPEESQYYAKTHYSRITYLSVLANVLLLASLLFAASRVARSGKKPWIRMLAEVAFLAFLLPVFDFIRRYFGIGYTGFLRYGLSGFVAGASIAGLGIFLLRARLCRYGYAALLYSAPLVAITFSQDSWYAMKSDWPQPASTSRETGGIASTATSKHRVVWIIFDEWDQGATFDQRPADLKLPNIDAFAKEAFVSTNAYPPAGNTMISMPSLITGRYLTKVKPRGYDSLQVRVAGSTADVDFRELPNLFTEYARAGKRVAIAGWFHPYSRLVPAAPNIATHFEVSPLMQGFRGNSFIDSMVAQFRYAFAPSLVQRACVDSFLNIHAFARDAVRDPRASIVFIHYPIPHMPGIYEPSSGQFLLRFESVSKSYYANLALTDRALCEILGDLDASGLRDKTAIILSSDHWWRESPTIKGERDHRVPFMIQLPGERQPFVYSNKLNTVLTSDLVREIADAKIMTSETLLAHLSKSVVAKDYHYDSQGYLVAPPTDASKSGH